jgi:hypothetical protein
LKSVLSVMGAFLFVGALDCGSRRKLGVLGLKSSSNERMTVDINIYLK